MKPSHEQGCIMRRFNIILIKKVLHRSSIQQTWAIVLPPTSKQPYMVWEKVLFAILDLKEYMMPISVLIGGRKLKTRKLRLPEMKGFNYYLNNFSINSNKINLEELAMSII